MLTQSAVGTGSREGGVGVGVYKGGGKEETTTSEHTRITKAHTHKVYIHIRGGATSHQIGCVYARHPCVRQE